MKLENHIINVKLDCLANMKESYINLLPLIQEIFRESKAFWTIEHNQDSMSSALKVFWDKNNPEIWFL